MRQSERVPVRTLLGAKGFDTSLICLRSLVEYSADPVRLVIHEDGTLTDEHREALRGISPAAEFVGRQEADEAVGGLLAKHPRCLAFRRSEIMALKLFDICLFGEGRRVAYCDSDFLFLRRYAGLFALSDTSTPVFMTDVGHAYAVRPWRLWPFGRFRLVGRLNAGLTLVPSGYLDLDFLEWLLGALAADPVFVRRRYWTEQTCWAALGARSGAGLLAPRQVLMATKSMSGYSADTVAIHFVATYRDRLPVFAAKQQMITDPAVTIRVRPGRIITAPEMFWTDLCRRLSPIN